MNYYLKLILIAIGSIGITHYNYQLNVPNNLTIILLISLICLIHGCAMREER